MNHDLDYPSHMLKGSKETAGSRGAGTRLERGRLLILPFELPILRIACLSVCYLAFCWDLPPQASCFTHLQGLIENIE